MSIRAIGSLPSRIAVIAGAIMFGAGSLAPIRADDVSSATVTGSPDRTTSAIPAPAPASPAPAPGSGRVVDPEAFGADGTDTGDDTVALQKAFDALQSGETLRIAAGRTYRHNHVLRVNRAGVRVTGPGALVATREEQSSLQVNADNVTLDGGLVLRMESTTRRWHALEQQKLVLLKNGAVVRNVTVDGSAAAGIFLYGTTNSLLEEVRVENTRADGIHTTFGSRDAVIRRAVVRNVGDDGIAVVSYEADPSVVRNIRVESPRFYGNVWGRGYSVVGGQDIIFTDVHAENSHGAAVYIAVEEEFKTQSVERVKVLGGIVKNANISSSGEPDHGAILVYNSRPGFGLRDVTIDGLRIVGTRKTASRQLGILDWGKATTRITFSNLEVNGGGTLFGVVNSPTWKMTNVSVDGVKQPDHEGFR